MTLVTDPTASENRLRASTTGVPMSIEAWVKASISALPNFIISAAKLAK